MAFFGIRVISDMKKYEYMKYWRNDEVMMRT